jgi:hypothetical protein
MSVRLTSVTASIEPDERPSLGATASVDGEDPVDGLIAQADALLADLEARSLLCGEGAALPFLGLARFELSAIGGSAPMPSPRAPATYEEGAAQVRQLLDEALELSPTLDRCLHVLRARGLLREPRRWARTDRSRP